MFWWPLSCYATFTMAKKISVPLVMKVLFVTFVLMVHTQLREESRRGKRVRLSNETDNRHQRGRHNSFVMDRCQ